MNNKSFSVKSIDLSFPSLSSAIIFVATFLFSEISKSTSVTFILYWNLHLWFSRYLTIGFTIELYWSYLVNLSADKSVRPPTWWMKRFKYNFISKAECQFSKANIVLHKVQKSEFKSPSEKISSIALSSSSSSWVMQSSAISLTWSWVRLNLPSS